ncbi:MAG: PIN domain-containing protein [Alphaproteobacteria bacterium]|nr:PIN domain-containing protein [Alphaproteobacteria bacterium]
MRSVQALLDLNVLLALAGRQHVFHEAAHAWFAGNAGSGWATCPITQNGLLRILTTPTYPNRLPMAEAIEVLHLFTQHPDHEFWPEDISILNERFFNLAHLRHAQAVTDAYLLGLAVSRNARLVTFDRKISRLNVPAATPDHLVCLLPGSAA